MTVDGLQAVVVADDNIFTVATTLVAYDAYLTRESGADGVADINLDVKSLMLTSPARTELRVNLAARSGHAETTEVNLVVGWDGTRAAAEVVRPVCIDVGCGVIEVSRHGGCVESYVMDVFESLV